MKQNEYKMYMDFAKRASENSHAVRKKVGAIVVTANRIILPGWNGTPSGMDNCCEYIDGDGKLVTKPEVLHAELNAISKATKEGISLKGATLFVTLSPCTHCCNIIIQSGITRVIYLEKYKYDNSNYLKQCGIEVEEYYG
jgi:dCMP deaminase